MTVERSICPNLTLLLIKKVTVEVEAKKLLVLLNVSSKNKAILIILTRVTVFFILNCFSHLYYILNEVLSFACAIFGSI